jgi:hypothetical protein
LFGRSGGDLIVKIRNDTTDGIIAHNDLTNTAS